MSYLQIEKTENSQGSTSESASVTEVYQNLRSAGRAGFVDIPRLRRIEPIAWRTE
jgi:hypothetical protein